ncbi:MAG: pentapeptide repeat-containing protein [Synechococcaceae cyanobacterium RL_1_2]|nr:pentapeptide repeat-containing protein [Synechococcaceae cyanobacterium RL_1_2]
MNKINFSSTSYGPTSIGQYIPQIDLMGASLDGLNLTSVDLSRTNLAFASFTQANLEGTNVAKANVAWSNFSYANCKGANLSEINAEGADFSYADLTDADLSNAYLKNCCFYRANLNEEQRKILTGKPVFFDREGFDLYNQDLLRQNHKTYALNVTLTEHGDAIDIDIESAEGDLLDSWANPDDAPVLQGYSETLITNTGHETQEEPSPFFVLDNLKHLQTQGNEENIETMIIDG